ncbi:MAG: hypothetical protein Kow0042_13030 [Calditrichia bacterium]
MWEQGQGVFDKKGRLIALEGFITDITERKQAEEKLRFLSAVVEQSTDGIAIAELDGTITFANEAWCKMLGYPSSKNLLGKNLSIFHTPEQLEKDVIPFIEKVRELGTYRGEVGHVTRDGKTFPTAMVITLLKDDQGKPIAMVGIANDITERKKVEEALRESEELYRAVVENSHNGILIVGEDYKFIYVNDKLCEILGRSRDEIVGYDFREFLDEESKTLVADRYIRRRRGEEVPSRYTFNVVRKNGEKRRVEISSVVVRDTKNRIRTVGQIRDIIEQEQAELQREAALRAMQESEEKYRNLIQHSGDAIYLLYNRRFEVINEKFQEMFGLTLEDVNKPDFDFISLVAPKSRPMVEDRARRLAAGEKLEPKYEFTALNAAGEEIEVETSVTYIKYKEGIATQGIIRDITERKRLEEQLRQAQKMEAVGQLAGGVAHDFNNLLTVINGYCDLLLYQELPEKVRGPIDQIHKTGKRATRLVSQLLAFSRRQIIQPKIVNINDLILDQHKMLSRLLGEDIEIDLHLDSELGVVRVDPGQMEQVIMNIAVNARDAMPFGGKLTIETQNVEFDKDYVRTHAGAKAGYYVMLAISDNGVGMDEATCSRIFEPFFTTKGRDKGTGLGLSTVYGIVKQNEGFIYVYSELQKGTTFKIYLPRTRMTPQATDAPTGNQPELRGSETILLVEDDPSVLELTRIALSEYGYTVLSATNGEEALRIHRQYSGTIDLLLTDVIMPSMGGKELAEKMLEENPQLKIIYISGYTDNAIAHYGVLEEGVEFVEKPYSHLKLIKRIRQVLDKP